MPVNTRLGYRAAALAAGTLLTVGGMPGVARAELEIVVSTIEGTPKAKLPGSSTEEFQFLLRPYASPDGSRWIMRAGARVPPTSSSRDHLIIEGRGGNITVVEAEGQAAPFASDRSYTQFQDALSINNAGQYAFAANLTPVTGQPTRYIVRWNGSMHEVVLKAMDPVPAVPSQTYSTSTRNPVIDSLGRVAVQALSMASSGSSAIVRGNELLARTGVTPIGGLEGNPGSTWKSFITDRLSVSASGADWMVLGTNQQNQEILALNNAAVLEQGRCIAPGCAQPVARIYEGWLMPNGDWFARGKLARDASSGAEPAFLVRNGEVIAMTGDLVTPASTERIAGNDANVFTLAVGDSRGNYLYSADTNGPAASNAVLVYNGRTVLAREGDRIDIDGDDILDDAYIGQYSSGTGARINPFDRDAAFIDDSDPQRPYAYFVARVRNASDMALGPVLFRVELPDDEPTCRADFDGQNGVQVADIFAFLRAWFAGDARADFDGQNGVQVADIFAFLRAWFAGC